MGDFTLPPPPAPPASLFGGRSKKHPEANFNPLLTSDLPELDSLTISKPSKIDEGFSDGPRPGGFTETLQSRDARYEAWVKKDTGGVNQNLASFALSELFIESARPDASFLLSGLDSVPDPANLEVKNAGK